MDQERTEWNANVPKQSISLRNEDLRERNRDPPPNTSFPPKISSDSELLSRIPKPETSSRRAKTPSPSKREKMEDEPYSASPNAMELLYWMKEGELLLEDSEDGDYDPENDMNQDTVSETSEPSFFGQKRKRLSEENEDHDTERESIELQPKTKDRKLCTMDDDESIEVDSDTS